MFHSKRTWGPPREVESARELATLLTERTWCLCSAFRHAGYLYLNDATSEDGASEFAILKERDSRFIQVESITFSWTSLESAETLIERVGRGEFDEEGFAVAPRIDDSEKHRCPLCA